MERSPGILCFEQAADCLPVRLRRLVATLSDAEKEVVEEIRLRVGRPMSVLLAGGEIGPWSEIISCEDLETVVNVVTEFSRYAAAETLRNGYLPAKGGCRVGLCGTAVMKEGINTNLRDLSSLVIRVAREKRGIARPVVEQLLGADGFVSTLLLAPPGGGKTTLLRDLIRCLSSGDGGQAPLRVALADERSEIAVMYRGQPQLDVGFRTDVLDGCPKAAAIPMLLRTMNPQVIAVDEVTVAEDIRVMTAAANCGVALLATIHATDVAELSQKPLYGELLAARVFRRAVLIRCQEGRRCYEVVDLPC